MELEEIKSIIGRIVDDFSPLLPGLRAEFLGAEAFDARVRGRPILPDEKIEDTGMSYPAIHSFAVDNRIIVSEDGILARAEAEAGELRRPLVEGLILREIVYLAMVRIPEPLPRARADDILRRYWPLQYVILQEYAFHNKSDKNI